MVSCIAFRYCIRRRFVVWRVTKQGMPTTYILAVYWFLSITLYCLWSRTSHLVSGGHSQQLVLNPNYLLFKIPFVQRHYFLSTAFLKTQFVSHIELQIIWLFPFLYFPRFESLSLTFSGVSTLKVFQSVPFGIMTVFPSLFKVWRLCLYIDCLFTTHRVHGISDIRMGRKPTTINVWFRAKSLHSRWYFDDEYFN